MTAEPLPSEQNEEELVEVARARDRFEAGIWARNLEELGIPVTIEKAVTRWPQSLLWLRSLLYLWRTPHAVSVARKHHARALDYLKKFRFI